MAWEARRLPPRRHSECSATRHHPSRSFLVTCYGTKWNMLHLAINAAVLALLIIAKLPEMHGVRLLGVNAARVD